MSDIFDHEADAYDSLNFMEYEPEDSAYSSRYHPRPDHEFKYNPLFYHERLKIKGILAVTDKAYLFKVSKKYARWVPKSVCRNLKRKSVYVHSITLARSERILIQQ